MALPPGERLKAAHAAASRRLANTYRAVCTHRSLVWALIAVFSLFYFGATCYIASLKPFWLDELATYHIARSPTVADVWRTWLASPDGLPPTTHLVAHVVYLTLGFSHVTARLPDMVGYWVMCLAVFAFLRRRVCPMLAFTGMLLPLTIPAAYTYAYEMRGYGMVAGFSALAVVCWDLARDARLRRIGLIGLPLCLAAATALQPLAILIVVPLGLAELTRTIERSGRLDVWTWLGVCAPAVLLLPWNPVVSHSLDLPEVTGRTNTQAWRVLLQFVDVWPQFLPVSATTFGLLALVCLARSADARPDGPPARQLPNAEWVLAIGLALLPVVSWILAHAIIGFVELRYVIATVVGFGIGIPLLCRLGIRRRPEIALLLAVWTAIAAAGSTFNSWYTLRMKNVSTAHIAKGEDCFRLLKIWPRLPADDLPIVVSHIYVYHQLHHYAPEALKARLVFIVDREFGRLIVPAMPYMRNVFGEHLEEADAFVQSHRSFYVFDCGSASKWPLVNWLLRQGASLHEGGVGDNANVRLGRDFYKVSMESDAASASRR